MNQKRERPPQRRPKIAGLTFHPVTVARWPDLETLFGPRGACAGCWCMWWRQTRAQYEHSRGEANRQAMKAIVEAGEVPGILAYVGKEPAGWCSIGPRQVYSALERSRLLKRLDDEPVWSVVCFFVARPFRGQGLSAALLRAAVVYAGKRGATTVEGYPMDPRGQRVSDAEAFYGTVRAFLQAGFEEVARPSERRAIMRRRPPRRRPA
jgi:GNAT superfamily N-acetyltransferase